MKLPIGHQQVVPYVMVGDGGAFIRFVQLTFDAQVGPLARSANGTKIIHGELKLGESVIFFADGAEEDVDWLECDPNNPEMPRIQKEPSTIHLFIYVEDAAETLERAEKAGGTSVIPLMDDESGQMGGFVDPFSNLWWVKSLKG